MLLLSKGTSTKLMKILAMSFQSLTLSFQVTISISVFFTDFKLIKNIYIMLGNILLFWSSMIDWIANSILFLGSEERDMILFITDD